MKQHSTIYRTLFDSDLDEIRALIEQRSAILFDASRERFFSTRVREYFDEHKIPTAAEFLKRLRESSVEYRELLERLLTQETSFFRYPAVFDALEKTILPQFQEQKRWQNSRKLRIWSAGCSTGEESYSIAITVADSLKFAEAWEIEILATDISRRALQHAEKATYSIRSLAHVPEKKIRAHFEHSSHGYKVKLKTRKLVSFAQVNLADPVYMGKVDCVFCMNVLMYFSEEQRIAALRRLHDALEPGGYLLLGHSETLANVPLTFESTVVGDCRVYRKPLPAEAAQPIFERAVSQ